MTKQSDELKMIVKEAKELDAATAARVLVVIADIMEAFENQIDEFKQQARETNVNVLKSFIDTNTSIQVLRSDLSNYRDERNKSEFEEKQVAFALAAKRANNALTTNERMEVNKIATSAAAIAAKASVVSALKGDKIEIRGVQIPSRLLPWMVVAFFILLVLIIVFLPDTFSQILLKLADMIGGGR